MIRSMQPGAQQEGYRLLQEWQTRLQAVQHIERGGMIFSGNDYVGYKPTGIPAKPDVQMMDVGGGVKVPIKPSYDPSGRQTGYDFMPLGNAGRGQTGQAAPGQAGDIGQPGTK